MKKYFAEKAVLRNLLVLLFASRPVASLSNTPLSKICSSSFSQIFVRTILLLLISIFATGCKEKSYIIFNHEAITQENILNASYVFSIGERVYYVITLPEPVLTGQLFIQVYKRDNKEMRYGYKLVYGKTVKLKNEQQNYYTDYYVFNETGLYEFKVYSKDNPTKELTSNIVQVR